MKGKYSKILIFNDLLKKYTLSHIKSAAFSYSGMHIKSKCICERDLNTLYRQTNHFKETLRIYVRNMVNLMLKQTSTRLTSNI